jgi:hypothetical protein
MPDPDVRVVGSPTWRRWQEIPAVCFDPRNLRSTLAVAALVGTLLVLINQLDVVLSGGFGTHLWLKVLLTYLVPFVVSNYGLVIGSRRNTH